MKRVATLTFQEANNYGAMLQCYALQKTIEKMKVDCKVINYRCDYLSKPYSLKALKRKGIPRYILGNINAFIRLFRRKKFKEFRNLIPMTSKVSKNTICSICSKFDCFIVGSDCVWNNDITNNDTTYLLDFVNDNHKKNSYAASFGFTQLPNEVRNTYIDSLSKFRSLNVRELSGKRIIENEIYRKANVVIDPTLLLEKDEWDKIIVNLRIKSKYIFVYQLSPSKYMNKIVKKLKKITGYNVIYIPFPLGSFIPCKFHLTFGPREWISLIKNAEFIVTDSFHGTAFSIIYNKKVYCCVNRLATRITSLLKLVQMEECLFDKNKEFKLIKDIDYNIVNENLNRIKENSLNELKSIIGI